MEDNITKITHLRNNEYYCMQEMQDFLYKKSRKGTNFYKLIRYIKSDNNIRLAYRNIKTNDGSKTNGLSGRNMTFIARLPLSRYLKVIKNIIMNYIPAMIKRVGIPKGNGKIRYLGIKEPIDKITEQAIYQVLEPILTAKFHNNSNGFIKGRSANRAIAQYTNYIIKEKLYYVIDLDIKSFFDNVNHGKLLKQLWTSGVRDKNLLSLISKMLKAEVFREGIPEKGTPQGGILSPLLANLVLNEFDWWLESKAPKGIRFVRYADDVKILCPTYLVAREMLGKINKWLNQRLKLEVSEEKTKIINLKKNYSQFLGIKLKLKRNKKKYKIVSHMTEKAIESTKEKVKRQIKKVKRTRHDKERNEKQLEKYNSLVRGIHNYYNKATNIRADLTNIKVSTKWYINTKMKDVLTYKSGTENKIPLIRGKPLMEIGEVTHEPPRYKSNKINYFEEKSRKHFYKKLEIINLFMIDKLLANAIIYESVEFNDNVISKFCGQLGKYAITNEIMFDIRNINPIRIKENGTDKYDNIIIVNNKVKKIIKQREVDDIIEISNLIRGVNKEQLKKINKIREENSLPLIML